MTTLATSFITSSAVVIGDKLGAFARLAIGDSDGPTVGMPKKLRPNVAPGDELFDVAEEFEDGKGVRSVERTRAWHPVRASQRRTSHACLELAFVMFTCGSCARGL
jgi:hypothetical protein